MDDGKEEAIRRLQQSRISLDLAHAALRSRAAEALAAGATQREVRDASGLAMNTMRKYVSDLGLRYSRGRYEFGQRTDDR